MRSVGKKPVPYIASSRTSTGGSTGTNPRPADAVEREPVEREREQRGVADDVAEARAGETCGPFHVEAPDLRVLLRVGELRRLADSGRSRPRRRRCRRRVRSRPAGSERARAPRRGRPPRRRAPARRAAAPPSRRAAPRAARASACPSASCARGARRRGARAPASARRRRAAASNGLRRTLAREPAPEVVRVVPGGAEVDHASESR